MKFKILVLTAGTAAASAGHLKTQQLPKLNTNNRMSTVRQIKLSQRDASRAAGLFDEGRYKSLRATPYSNSTVAGEYSCQNTTSPGR